MLLQALRGLSSRLSYANVVSSFCLFVLLGGGAYAATRLPRNSVGGAQLKRNAVSSTKVKNRSLRAIDFKRGQLPRGPQGRPGATGVPGSRGPAGPPGTSPGLFEPTFTHVALDGAMDQARTQGPVFSARRVTAGGGKYCLDVVVQRPNTDVVTTPRSVRVTPESEDTTAAATVDPAVVRTGCTGGNVLVTLTKASDGTPKDSAFYAAFD